MCDWNVVAVRPHKEKELILAWRTTLNDMLIDCKQHQYNKITDVAQRRVMGVVPRLWNTYFQVSKPLPSPKQQETE